MFEWRLEDRGEDRLLVVQRQQMQDHAFRRHVAKGQLELDVLARKIMLAV
jgi:hypothetical protein